MDPITDAVLIILGKYAIDKGMELAKEAGPKAVDVAVKLFQKVADRFKQNSADAQNLERFEHKPDSYKAPVADSLTEYLKEPAFATEIKQLLAQYQAVASSNAPGTNFISQIAGDDAIQIGQAQGSQIDITRGKRDQPPKP